MRRCRGTWLVTVLMLWAAFAAGMTQVHRASITFDEGPHLAVGYTVLRTGDFRLQPIHIHPPLANVLAAAPLLLQHDLPAPESVDGWEINSLSAITDAVVWQYRQPDRIATAGRVPILLVSTLLGALVYRWARDLGGQRAGLAALGLVAFDPNLIAHGALITTDATTTTLIVATLFVLFRHLRAPKGTRRKRGMLLLMSMLLGMAQLAKVSALMLVPVVGVAILADAWRQDSSVRGLVAGAGRGILACVVAAVVVWAGYGFSVTPVPGIPFDVPAGTHVRIFQSLRQHYDLGHDTFALGRFSDSGWWWYFPVAFALKTPLPVLILALLVSLLYAARIAADPRGTVRLDIDLIPVVLFPLGYAAAAVFSTVNIGYRHLLPLLPFLYMALGVGLHRLVARGPWRVERWGAWPESARVVLGLWLVAGTLRSMPYPLAFFNALAGGSRGGYRYLVDSNLDWGQNLWDLKRWMADHDEAHVYYAHYSPANPATYGITAGAMPATGAAPAATFLPPDPRAGDFAPWHPAPGLYAIGATVLQGPYAPDINTYAWFRGRAPTATLGHALFLYNVPAQPAPSWVVLCTNRPDAVALPALTSNDALRVLRPDCETTAVYPAEDRPGLYVLPPTAPPPLGGESWLTLRNHKGETTAQVFRVTPTVPTPSTPAISSVEGPATFLGHTLHTAAAQPGKIVLVTTYWRVDEAPARPLSLMAHLMSANGTAVAVADGLGLPIEQWRAGDLILQTHSFTMPHDLAEGQSLEIVAGAYWLDTIERWRTPDGKDSMVLETLPVGK